MKRATSAVVGSLLVLALSASGAAAGDGVPKPNNVAAKLCQAEKHADRAAFEATYGAKHTMRECKRKHRGEAKQTLAVAAEQCKAEQEADPVLFAQTYGTKKNAFGKCVSAKVQEEAAEEGEAFKNAAAACRAERAADPELFAQTYGTNANKKNAFGKCVSTKARADDEYDEGPITT